MPGKHSAKEKRQAQHIIAGYKKRGGSAEEAERIGWATVNKQRKGFSIQPDASPAKLKEFMARKPKTPSAVKPPKTGSMSARIKAVPTWSSLGVRKAITGQVSSWDQRQVRLKQTKKQKPKPFQPKQVTKDRFQARYGQGAPIMNSLPIIEAQIVTLEALYKTVAGMPKRQRRDTSATQPIDMGWKPEPVKKQPWSGGLTRINETKQTRNANRKTSPRSTTQVMDVHKSNDRTTEDRTMSRYERMFKSALPDVDLSDDSEKVLIECPHCDAPITKSEVLAKAKNAAHGNMSHDNKSGKHHKGPESGANKKTPTRTKDGARKNSPPLPGAYAAKSDHEEEDIDDTADAGDESVEKAGSCSKCGKPDALCKCDAGMKKSLVQAPVIRGTAFVQYVDTGADAELAKAIQEGRFGNGAIVSQPIDKQRS
jgi:hypothetical protein